MTLAHLRMTLLLFGLSTTGSISTADDGKFPITAPVKVISTTLPATPASMNEPRTATRRPVQAPTTPGAKYPQYQLGHDQRNGKPIPDASNPQLRFFLCLPKNILLVEAKITIDDQPFRRPRESRVERMLKEAMGDSDSAKNSDAIDTSATSVAPIATAPQSTSNVPGRLRHTVKASGVPLTAEEVHWILNNWIDGPVVLQLNDNFQRFRASQRPGFVILDRDHDGTVSVEEMRLAAQSFEECDLNRDEIIQFTEVAVAAASLRTANPVTSGPLMTLLPDETTAAAAYQRIASVCVGKDVSNPLVARFDANGNGQFDADELTAARTAAPDVSLSIAFNTLQPDQSRLTVTAVAREYADAVGQATTDAMGINFAIAGCLVNFVAVQSQSSDQISIGAVNDGYPILPEIDPNDDGRLTIRELRGLSDALARFDGNRDGALTPDEVQAPIRICFGLGPIAHRELAGIRSVHNKAKSSPMMGPEWFVRMDRNKDNDLTRGEFPGTDEQFQILDADDDKLVSAQEAVNFDQKSQNPEKSEERLIPARQLITVPGSNSKEEIKP